MKCTRGGTVDGEAAGGAWLALGLAGPEAVRGEVAGEDIEEGDGAGAGRRKKNVTV